MLTLPLFLDTVGGQLITSLSNPAPLNAASIDFWIGDTITIDLYLLGTIINLPSPTAYPYYVLPIAGLAPQLFITDGTESGPNGNGNPFTQQIVWGTDPSGSYFTAQLPLNTASLKALVAAATTATATLKIGVYSGGYPQTEFSSLINLGVGIPEAPTAVPVPQTPLSVEVANQTYQTIQPVPGQAVYLESLAGKLLELIYVDNPDGTATLQENALN